MARQAGPLKYKGTIGDVRHFKIKGLKGHFAGLKGGVDAERIKNGDEFVRTRENNNEFGGSAKAGKYFRQILSPIMKGVADARVTSRVTALMKKVNVEDGSEARGVRGILMTARKDLVKDFEFNSATNFESVFRAMFTLNVPDSRNSAAMMIKDFDPRLHLNTPRGASHFRIAFAIASVSDYIFNAADNTYEPKVKESGLLALGYSDYWPTNGNLSDLNLSAELPNGTKPTEFESLVVCLGVEFYQQVSNKYYLLATGNCLKIADVK
jgi:hypothetical protein